MTKCPNCEASRYKSNASFSEDGVGSTVRKRKRASKKSAVCEAEDDTCIGTKTGQRKIPALVMWYLPVIDRLKRLFSNPNTAKLMTWHDDRPLKNDGKLRHPSDARQWKTFDANHELFGEEKRNVRFALSTDGMNPFGERNSTHSTWPVLLTIFNLPPWLCHKRKYLLLTILIQGPKQPGIDIDVFLEPLLEDMQILWNEGVRMWDEYRQEHFTLRAIIFVTINDYPALFALLGKIKGKTTCVVCVDKTASVYLTGSMKTVYMPHHRFLMSTHKYRKMKENFDGTNEKDEAPHPVTGQEVCEMCQKVMFNPRMKSAPGAEKEKRNRKRDKQDETTEVVDDVPFKKISIFFKYFPYWKELAVRHAIDGMHLQKNVFDSTAIRCGHMNGSYITLL